mgnify:FL=1
MLSGALERKTLLSSITLCDNNVIAHNHHTNIPPKHCIIQRVCGACWPVLEPHQDALADQISNAEKTNQIDLVDGTARYMNMPFSLTLGSEIRKASYSLHNMFSSDWVEDKDIPARLLRDAKGIAFLTVAKAGT